MYGGHVGQVTPAHGDAARVEHDGSLLFGGMPSPFTAVRYHSLAAVAVPDVLVETAWCDGDGRPGRDGGRAPREALVGRAVPPRVDPHRARRAAGPRTSWSGRERRPGAALRRAGGVGTTGCSGSTAAASRAWSGRRSILGFLRDEDVSLTYDAAARRVARHQHGRSERGRRRRVRRARRGGRARRRRPVGQLGRLPRLRLPAGPARAHRRAASPTRSGCACATRCSWSTTTRVVRSRERSSARSSRTTPARYADAFDEVQRQLRLGNSYEVNLTYREAVTSGVDPVSAYLRLRAPARRRTRGTSSTATLHLLQLEPGAVRARRPRPVAGDQADQGHHAARRDADEDDERLRRVAGDRPEVPRREPDDRRPAPQRPLDGLRAGHGDRARR